MTHLHFYTRLAVLLTFIACFTSGCGTTLTPEPERAARQEDPLGPPAGEVLGTVVLVDPEEAVALVEVRSASARTAPALLTRNESLLETARLEPTRFQRGRTLGTRIVSGLPNVGDEVVAERE